MKHTIHLLSLFLVLSLSSCKNVTSVTVGNGPAIEGNGVVITENRNLRDNFYKVTAQGIVNVHLTKGNSKEIKIQAEENLMDLIVTEVKNGNLLLAIKGNLKTTKPINIYLDYQDLNEVTSSGSTNVYVASPLSEDSIKLSSSGASNISLAAINANQLFVKTSGSSNIKINSLIRTNNADLESTGASNITASSIETESLLSSTTGSSKISIKNILTEDTKFKASGASTINIEGKTNSLVAQVSGSSNLNAKSLTSNTASLQSSGASSVHVYVNDKLEVKASGASNTSFYGNPTHIAKETSGAASIKHR